jgi:hypothetical protein
MSRKIVTKPDSQLQPAQRWLFSQPLQLNRMMLAAQRLPRKSKILGRTSTRFYSANIVHDNNDSD